MHLSIVCHRDQHGTWVKLSITVINSKCCQASTPDGTLLLCCILWKYTTAIFLQSCCCHQLATEKLESYTLQWLFCHRLAMTTTDFTYTH